VETHADFSLFELQYADIYIYRGEVLLRRHFVLETFCRGDVLCGDVLYVRLYKSVSTQPNAFSDLLELLCLVLGQLIKSTEQDLYKIERVRIYVHLQYTYTVIVFGSK
jgi:hypothetical protein